MADGGHLAALRRHISEGIVTLGNYKWNFFTLSLS